MITSIVHQWAASARNTLYVVTDLETGGLNNATNLDDPKIPEGRIGANTYPILEITAKFLDGNFNEVSDPMTFVIHHEKAILMNTCSEWSIKEFKDTLFNECQESKYSLQEVDELIAERINSINAKEKYILGNSVDLDRSYVVHQMPKISKSLHYRIVDVSSMKIIFTRLFGEVAKFDKSGAHRTESDVNESIAELKFYIANFVKSRDTVAREQCLN